MKGDERSNRGELLLRKSMLRMTRQAGVIDPLDFAAAGEKFGCRQGIAAGLLHPQLQRAQA